MSTHAQPGIILACAAADMSPHAEHNALPAQAADAAWSPAALGAAVAWNSCGAQRNIGWCRLALGKHKSRPRHGRPCSAQRDTRTGRCRRQRPGSSDSSTAAAAPSARTQERAAAAAACSHSLGCDRRKAIDTARREHAPMGNSASSARKAAVLTARGTYRGPPTCAAGLVAQQHAQSLEALSGRARQLAPGDQRQSISRIVFQHSITFKAPNSMGTPGLLCRQRAWGRAVQLCLQTSCHHTAQQGSGCLASLQGRAPASGSAAPSAGAGAWCACSAPGRASRAGPPARAGTCQVSPCMLSCSVQPRAHAAQCFATVLHLKPARAQSLASARLPHGRSACRNALSCQRPGSSSNRPLRQLSRDLHVKNHLPFPSPSFSHQICSNLTCLLGVST